METLLDNCEKHLTPVLKTIIVMDPFDAAVTERASKCEVEVLSLKDVEVITKALIKYTLMCCQYFYIFSVFCLLFLSLLSVLIILNLKYIYIDIYFLHFRLWGKVIIGGQL